ncbi:hypothetical protein AB0D57_24060 [Streptomyces sp. NPDC048275]|uniref:hypothetical protein n=1 Tax=Streptomyces sp. NPDC048275 TaxID=3155629 RepID=UPI00341118DF
MTERAGRAGRQFPVSGGQPAGHILDQELLGDAVDGGAQFLAGGGPMSCSTSSASQLPQALPMA